jgi:methylenetetrahydrofolate dehydrogenase (NADP+)/methenyltetrahydrofolate cyclohydrolase
MEAVMEVLKGAHVSGLIKEQVEEMLGELNGYVPTLAIVRVGERPDDVSYEKGATKKLTTWGLNVKSYAYPEDISDSVFKKEYAAINRSGDIDGILLFRPLPGHINQKDIEAMTDPAKDLDGISQVNIAKVFAGDTDGFAPCTAEAVMELLRGYEIPISGKNVTIVGRSMVVGKPLSMLMLKENATVTICHTRTKDLKAECRRADILVACAGRARMLDASYVGEGAVVVDVGINVDEDGKLCGDVDYGTLDGVASQATPVPGGVGAVTTAVLAKHLVQAALRRRR